MILNIDLDGVLYPFEKYFHSFCQEITGKELPEISEWEIFSCWGIQKKEFDDLFRLFIMEGCFRNGDPYDNAVSVLIRLKEKHTINLVTARSYAYNSRFSERVQYKIRSDTCSWVSRIPHDGLMFTEEKALIRGILLDDSIKHLVPTSVCFDQPWNRSWTGDRVTSWIEFERYIDNYEINTTLKQLESKNDN